MDLFVYHANGHCNAVLMDDITENIEAIEEFVQSVNVASMNKI
jgi:translation elongation factor EF-1beta